MQHITVQELDALLKAGSQLQLIDVRQPHEHEAFNIGGELIPLDKVIANRQLLLTDVPVVFYCRVGVRSQLAIQRLEGKFPFQNLFNLTGGVEAWKKYFQPDHSAF
ncbi:MAG: rhodanese-like domain-containing protein [Bacteroidota bacterium]